MTADPSKIEAVRLLLADHLGVEVRAYDPGWFNSPVVFRIGTGQRIRVKHERFQDHDTPEEIFPSDALSRARRGDSFLLTENDVIEIENPED